MTSRRSGRRRRRRRLRRRRRDEEDDGRRRRTTDDDDFLASFLFSCICFGSSVLSRTPLSTHTREPFVASRCLLIVFFVLSLSLSMEPRLARRAVGPAPPHGRRRGVEANHRQRVAAPPRSHTRSFHSLSALLSPHAHPHIESARERGARVPAPANPRGGTDSLADSALVSPGPPPFSSSSLPLLRERARGKLAQKKQQALLQGASSVVACAAAAMKFAKRECCSGVVGTSPLHRLLVSRARLGSLHPFLSRPASSPVPS
jgi:hypothetical protein